MEPNNLPDPRNYIASGRRCAVKKSEWLDNWWVSHSPRNCNDSAEGSWESWVDLAKNILQADADWKASLAAALATPV